MYVYTYFINTLYMHFILQYFPLYDNVLYQKMRLAHNIYLFAHSDGKLSQLLGPTFLILFIDLALEVLFF